MSDFRGRVGYREQNRQIRCARYAGGLKSDRDYHGFPLRLAGHRTQPFYIKVSGCSLGLRGALAAKQFAWISSAGWTFCAKPVHPACRNEHEEGAGVCRPMQRIAGIRLPTARDEQDLAKSADIAAYDDGSGCAGSRLAEHAQGTGGVVGQASEAIGTIRASDLDARHNTCANLKKLYQELSPHCAQSQAH